MWRRGAIRIVANDHPTAQRLARVGRTPLHYVRLSILPGRERTGIGVYKLRASNL